MLWSNEDDNTLARLWNEENLTSGEIAFAMRSTRSAIAGRIKRLREAGMFLRSRPQEQSSRPRQRTYRIGAPKAKRGSADILPFPDLFTGPAPDPMMISMEDLTEGQCRYPIGDGPYLFCGHTQRPGSAYCNYHHGRCWKQASEVNKHGMEAAE